MLQKLLHCLVTTNLWQNPRQCFMFPFFIKNGLILQNQLRFKPGDSRVNQLLSIALQIYKSFYDGFDVRSMILDM